MRKEMDQMRTRADLIRSETSKERKVTSLNIRGGEGPLGDGGRLEMHVSKELSGKDVGRDVLS